MKVGIIGLGLIGGSFAKAYQKVGHEVLAVDTDQATLQYAIMTGAVSSELDDSRLPECDLILICTYPEVMIRFLDEKGDKIGSKPIVIDCCGTKRNIVSHGFSAAKKYGFTYVGGHPMAGTQFSGFKYSMEDLFSGATMVIVPEKADDICFLSRIKQLLLPASFGHITVTTAEKHDEIIAFTSQLAHVVSNAYIKSPTARNHFGISAGSYKDLTRVAWLNPEMWAQLFLDNDENLLKEIDVLMNNLAEYREALAVRNKTELIRLLEDGKKIKEEVDG